MVRFKKEFEECAPSPHEIMSAIILINDADIFLENKKELFDLELAARMVTGCTFDYNNADSLLPESKKRILGIKNCFIRLLNSQTVDVDKLDYITRDTQMSGFDNVPIDIHRLTKAVTAVEIDDKWMYPAFRKNALSVIDNVFRAKSEQNLWVVTHPIVLYEAELFKHCICELTKLIDESYIEEIFTLDALGRKGVKLKGKEYRLLNDVDINSDLRSFYDKDLLIQELYEREGRRHPVWKSYYEYKFLFYLNENQNGEEEVFLFFKALMDYMALEHIFVLDEEKMNEIIGQMDEDNNIRIAAEFLKKFCIDNELKPDFTLLALTNSFSSKFDPNSVYISFGKLPKRANKNYETYKFLKGESNKSDTKRMFYLYSKARFSSEQLENFKKSIIEKICPKHVPRA